MMCVLFKNHEGTKGNMNKISIFQLLLFEHGYLCHYTSY